MTRRTKAMLRAMGREDFEASLRETATDGRDVCRAGAVLGLGHRHAVHADVD